MPKLPLNEKDIRLIAKINEYQKLYGVSDNDISLELGVCRATWFHRKKNASTITLKELRLISKKCHIPMAELTQYI